MSSPRSIGIIAGSGIYPETFVRAARKAEPNARLVVVGFENETRTDLESQVEAFRWVRVGQLSKLIKFLVSEGVTEAVMMGQISPKNLFDLRPDLRILMMLAKVKKRNAETLFGAIAGELEKDGISLLPATTYLDDHLPSAGHVFGPILKPRTLEDLEYGFNIAKQTSALDIGQSVVVRHGTVLAVEAFEGLHPPRRRTGPQQRRGAGESLQTQSGLPFRYSGHRSANHRKLRRRRHHRHRYRGWENLTVRKRKGRQPLCETSHLRSRFVNSAASR